MASRPARPLALAALAVALVAAPALASSWGMAVDARVLSRYGPLGVDPAEAGERAVLPGADAVSVRVYVTDVLGRAVPGARLGGWIRTDGGTSPLSFFASSGHYDSVERPAYAGGAVDGAVALDYDADGAFDEWHAFAVPPWRP